MEKKHADQHGFHIMFNENLQAMTLKYTIFKNPFPTSHETLLFYYNDQLADTFYE